MRTSAMGVTFERGAARGARSRDCSAAEKPCVTAGCLRQAHEELIYQYASPPVKAQKGECGRLLFYLVVGLAGRGTCTSGTCPISYSLAYAAPSRNAHEK